MSRSIQIVSVARLAGRLVGLLALGSCGGAEQPSSADGPDVTVRVAIVTADLRRFIEFYTSVFELELIFQEETPAFSHAILRAGEGSWLHPAAVTGNAHGAALPDMFSRGHLDQVLATFGLILFFNESMRWLSDGLPQFVALPQGFEGAQELWDGFFYSRYRITVTVAALIVAIATTSAASCASS